jgi:hypothetical protein
MLAPRCTLVSLTHDHRQGIIWIVKAISLNRKRRIQAMTNSEAPVQGFFTRLKILLGRLWWIFPLMMIGGGYLVPELRLHVGKPIPANMPNLPWWMLGHVVLGVIWVIAALVLASNAKTSVSALRKDVFLTTLLWGCMLVAATYAYCHDAFAWALVAPLGASTLDAFITPDRSINNAAQKPIVQQERI